MRYRLLNKIAHGGMAEIFLALQVGEEGFEKQVVLKRILPALAADPAFVRMLVDEAHIASTLNHSNLVQVLDLGKSGDEYFLVLEFVDGWSLEQVRRRAQKARMKLPLPLALYVVSSLCRGLAYVHTRKRNGRPQGIVHRDVTPQNVLLSREGEVKLADFGIAKAVGKREKSATGIIKGKFAYMSPEQTIGGDLDARSDLFSVGTLLYILTTGHKPFDGTTDLDVLMQVRKARYEKPSNLVRDFNPDVERFIARALRADRTRRWQTAEQMADRIDATLVKLALPSGAAALKRWLESLGAKDGVKPPAEISEATVSSGTIELVSGDLELQDVGPGDASAAAPVPDRQATEGTLGAAEREPPPASSFTIADYQQQLLNQAEAKVLASGSTLTVVDYDYDYDYVDELSGVTERQSSFTDGLTVAKLDDQPTAVAVDDDVPLIEVESSSATISTTPPPAPSEIVVEAGSSDLARELETRLAPEPELAPELTPEPEPEPAPEPAPEPPNDGFDQSATATRVATPSPSLLDAEVAFAAPTRVVTAAQRPRRAAVGTLVVVFVIVGGGAYFARSYLPPWLVEPVKAWLHRLPVPSGNDLTGDPRVPEGETR